MVANSNERTIASRRRVRDGRQVVNAKTQTNAATVPDAAMAVIEKGQTVVADTHARNAFNPASLRFLAESYFDFQKTRIANSNRRKRLQRVQDRDQVMFEGIVEETLRVEKDIESALIAQYRRDVPQGIVAWQKRTPGLGETLIARLIGHLGHPRIATPKHWVVTAEYEDAPTTDKRYLAEGEPYERSVAQLWAFCGVGDPMMVRRAKMSQDDLFACGSPVLKMLIHEIAELSVRFNGEPDKNGRKRALSPYRATYDAMREKYADRVHATPCVRCGPKGHPAPEGSPWKPSHQHAAALRKVKKEILRDLWEVADE